MVGVLIDISGYVVETSDIGGDVGHAATNCLGRDCGWALYLKVWHREACCEPSPIVAEGGGA